MERIAIFAALQWECRPAVRRLARARRENAGGFTVWSGNAGARSVVVVKTGVGPARAAAAARAAEALGRFDLIVSTGCAGALTAATAPGDVVVADQVLESDGPARYETDAARREQARAAAARAELRVTVGPIMCSPRVLATPAEKHAAAARTGAVAVDMEGTSIGAHAARHGVPFAAMRAIFDTVEVGFDESAAVFDLQTGALKPLALARYLASRPGALSYLLAMKRLMGAAEEGLDRFFSSFLA